MEGGTLDFEDLMDTGDEFPGFEIAKFTPANGKDSEDNSILSTPEHTSEAESSSKSKAENGDLKELSADEHGSSKAEQEGEKLNGDITNTDKQSSEAPKTERQDDASVEQDKESDQQPAAKSSEDYEPKEKKKKLYLQPPRPKMKLWGGQKTKATEEGDKVKELSSPSSDSRTETETKSEDSTRDSEDVTEKGDNSAANKDSTISEEAKEKPKEDLGKKAEEEDPHQQSFLSFLNLKPGASKADTTQKQKESEKDFYSRKRLRTRKKVSYVEDVQDDKDDSYSEEEEDATDHQFNIPARRRSRTNSKSPASGVASYVKALSNTVSPSQAKVMPATTTQLQLQQMQLKQLQQQQQQQQQAKLLQLPNLVNDLTGGGSTNAAGQIKGLFECGLCGTFFNTASQFISHQETAHKEENRNGKSGMETFRCEICQFVLTNRFAYLEHKRMKHMKSQVAFSCNKCSRTFAYLVDLQKHKETCCMPGPYCSICKIKFQSLALLETHRKKVHMNPNTRQWLNCVNKTCTFKCLTQHEMRIHIQNKHMINELFPCNAPKCARIFSTREQLNEHKKEQHASEFIVQYQCVECKMCYSSKTLLAEHQYLHTMEKMRKCDICSRQFSTITQLKKHKEVHACKGTLQCSACYRWCFDKQELTNHVCQDKRGKLGLRIYFCDICLKDFKADEKMFAHRKEHKNYYQCGTCLWECDTEDDYFEHREVHGFFSCNECCEELASESDLTAHKKAHKYYVKMVEEAEDDDGQNQPVMYLCPNLLDVIKA